MTDVLRVELARRRRRNPRYSLRGFARALGVHHATLSRLLRRDRPMAARAVRALAARLGLSDARTARLTHDEATAGVAAAVRRPDFQPSSRWIATVTGLPTDAVNVALHDLLRAGRLRMPTRARWALDGDAGEHREASTR